MPDFKSKMAGLQCKAARMTYNLNIVLGFGEAIEEAGPHGPQRGWTWEVRSWDGIWRVTKGNKTLLGSWNDENVIEARLPSLVGLTVNQIEHVNLLGDVKVRFTDETTLEILALSGDGEGAWSIKGPDGWFPASAKGNPLTEEEARLSAHAEACFKRWREKVPIGNEGRRCKQCAYYRHLQGAFYFWDFGLCTNANSEYDGRVVSVESGCDFFSASLPAVISQVEKK